MDSQCQQILNALQGGQELTPIDALVQFNCFRLAARIWDIKHQGYEVLTKTIVSSTGKRIVCYYMQVSAPEIINEPANPHQLGLGI